MNYFAANILNYYFPNLIFFDSELLRLICFVFYFFFVMTQVRLTLRRLDTLASKYLRNRSNRQVDDDSGQESPVSMTNSAIVRRKRHRSTSAWSKHTKTIHPKSSKKSIEKLMKLILEQGETIQHQLTKIR